MTHQHLAPRAIRELRRLLIKMAIPLVLSAGALSTALSFRKTRFTALKLSDQSQMLYVKRIFRQIKVLNYKTRT